MMDYNNSSRPCFAGDCIIKMSQGSKRVDQIKRGDVILGGAKVVCVLKTVSKDGYQELCKFENGLIITPWHPLKHNGTWTFP